MCVCNRSLTDQYSNLCAVMCWIYSSVGVQSSLRRKPSWEKHHGYGAVHIPLNQNRIYHNSLLEVIHHMWSPGLIQPLSFSGLLSFKVYGLIQYKYWTCELKCLDCCRCENCVYVWRWWAWGCSRVRCAVFRCLTGGWRTSRDTLPPPSNPLSHPYPFPSHPVSTAELK